MRPLLCRLRPPLEEHTGNEQHQRSSTQPSAKADAEGATAGLRSALLDAWHRLDSDFDALLGEEAGELVCRVDRLRE